MIHDKILKELSKVQNGPPPVFFQAIRKVVELHRKEFGISSEDIVCDHCKILYPCETIQAIEKGLA